MVPRYCLPWPPQGQTGTPCWGACSQSWFQSRRSRAAVCWMSSHRWLRLPPCRASRRYPNVRPPLLLPPVLHPLRNARRWLRGSSRSMARGLPWMWSGWTWCTTSRVWRARGCSACVRNWLKLNSGVICSKASWPGSDPPLMCQLSLWGVCSPSAHHTPCCSFRIEATHLCITLHRDLVALDLSDREPALSCERL